MAQVVITGANRGIGLALARAYAQAGDQVLALCRTPDRADALNALAGDSGGRVRVGRIDIADGASIEAAAALAGGPVDILVNNAGVFGGMRQSLDDIDYAAWEETLRTMVIGPFRVTRAFLPALLKAAAPKVMFVSSQIASMVSPFAGYYIYGSAKSGGNRVATSLATDLRSQNVIIASVHPGYVKTDMGGPDADITPEESAAGIKAVIARLTMADTGHFFKWNGEIHPW